MYVYVLNALRFYVLGLYVIKQIRCVIEEPHKLSPQTY